MLAVALPAEQYDRLLEAIHIPKGAYFNTGCVITQTPRVIARVSPDDATSAVDLFGVKARSAGCWILNLDKGKFYYRYGTASSGGAKGEYSAGQYLEINCGKSLIVNGSSLQTASDYDFSANDTAMTIPGTSYLGAITLMSFKIEDGGEIVRDFVPAEKNGEYGLYDRVNDAFYANVGTGTVTEGVSNDPHVTWIGGSGKMSDSANWENGRLPGAEAYITIFGTNRAIVITNDLANLQIATLMITNTAASVSTHGSITLTGNAITISGNADKSYFSACQVTNDVPLHFTGTDGMIRSVVKKFDSMQPITVDKKLSFRCGGATAAKEFNIYAPIHAEDAVLQAYSTVNVYLYAQFFASRMNCGIGQGNGRFYTYAEARGSSCTNVVVYHWGDFFGVAVANTFPTNMVMNWYADYPQGDDSTEGFALNYDQTADRIIGDEPVAKDGVTPKERMSVRFDKNATLTLRGTASATTYAKLQGTGNLVWDPVGDYTQEFRRRNHTLAGTLTVKRGTLKFSGTSTISNVTAIVVDGGRFEIESAVGLPATIDTVEVWNGGVVALPAGMSVSATRVLVDGVFVTPDTYSGATAAGWMDGTGELTAVNANKTSWKAPVSGDWGDATKWTAGVPDADDEAYVTIGGGDFTVNVAAGAVMPASLRVANGGAGVATISVNGAVAATNAYIDIGAGGMIDVPTGGSFTYRGIDGTGTRTVPAPAGSAPVAVNGGRFRVSGGTAFFDNYAGLLSVSGDGSATGRIEVTSGTLTYLPNHEYDFLLLKTGGEVAESGGDFVLDYAQTQDRSTLSQRGGRIVVTGGKFGRAEKGEHIYYQALRFGNGTTVVADGGKISPFVGVIPTTNGGSAPGVLTLETGSAVEGPHSTENFVVGATDAESDKTAVLNVFTTNMPTLARNVFIGAGGARESATVNVSNGLFAAGARNLDVGSGGTWRHSFNDVSRGVLNVYDGGRVFSNGEASFQTGFGTSRIYGINVAYGGYTTLTGGENVQGELNVYGGVVTNRYGDFSIGAGYARGRMLVDGGTVSVNHYHDRASASNRVFAVGLAGGTGACVVSNGTLEVNCYAYVGGAETNVFFTGYAFAANGYPADRHDAVGSLEFAGGNAQFNRGLVLGADGVGTFTRVGAAGSVAASHLVLSNSVKNASSGSVLRFVADPADGISPLVVAGTTTIRDNARLEVDLGDYNPAGRRVTLLRTAGFEGGEFSSVTLTGAHLEDAVIRRSATSLYVGSSTGTLIFVR